MDTPVAGTPLYVSLGEARLTFVFIPPGSFVMGSPAGELRRDTDEPQVPVEITRGFWLARTECTQALWRKVMDKDPSRFTGHPELPVESVSWNDVAGPDDSFLARMNRHPRHLPPGWGYALPTEAQWEYACRAGTTTPFSFGSVLNGALANCDGLLPYGTEEPGPYIDHTTRAGSYPPNPWGLYDMHGNVSELCADSYTKAPPGGRDPLVTSGAGRVIRGGSWWHHGWGCRSAARESVSESADYTLGFRLAIVPTG
jgi:formylglycine-generating enzyme required for sulfatase activity